MVRESKKKFSIIDVFIEEMDGQNMESIDDESFDTVTAMFSVLFFPDRKKDIRMHRVTQWRRCCRGERMGPCQVRTVDIAEQYVLFICG